MAEIEDAIDMVFMEHPVPGSITWAMLDRGDGAPLTLEEVRASVKLIVGGGFNERRNGIGTALRGL